MKRLYKGLIVLLVLVLGALLGGCTDKHNLRITGPVFVNVGDTVQLSTAYLPNEVVWQSSNEAVGIVDSNGVVTGVSAGSVTITVKLRKDSFITDSILIKVNRKEEPMGQLVLGIDNREAYLPLLKGKRVGLITNQSGVNAQLQSTIDVLHSDPEINLVALFAPEHGIRGAVAAGGVVDNSRDAKTDLPIYSLYGTNKAPTKEQFEKIDVLAIDIQDVGARFYTYIWTMLHSMRAAKQNNKEFLVFDRPNPIGDDISGPLLDPAHASFVGELALPIRHGMTIGELAKMFNESTFGDKVVEVGCTLHIVPMLNYARKKYFNEYNLQFIKPSPNIPTVNTAVVYPGMCLFEGTNVSEGRGTTQPFETIGAPYIDALAMAEALNALKLPGVKFLPTTFTPNTSKYVGVEVHGVTVHVTSRKTFEPVTTALHMLFYLKETYPAQFTYNDNRFIDKLFGLPYLYDGNLSLKRLIEVCNRDALNFRETRKPYLIYD